MCRALLSTYYVPGTAPAARKVKADGSCLCLSETPLTSGEKYVSNADLFASRLSEKLLETQGREKEAF